MSGRCRSMAVPSHSTTRSTKPSVIARSWLMPFAALVSVVLLSCTSGDAASTATATTAPPAVPPPTATQTQTPLRGTTAATGTTAAATTPPAETPEPAVEPVLEAYPVVAGSRPHDVAPAVDGGVWYTGQGNGTLGWLDPKSGEVREIALGPGSSPHGVIVGADGSAWVTDGGQNAIVRVDPNTDAVRVFRLPSDRPNANLNTAAFDGSGRLWFTGQTGVHGVFDPTTEEMEVFSSPRGRGPYGIATAPNGDVYYASLAGSYLGAIDLETGAVEELEPPTVGAGVRRVWFDSVGDAWIAEWERRATRALRARHRRVERMGAAWRRSSRLRGLRRRGGARLADRFR